MVHRTLVPCLLAAVFAATAAPALADNDVVHFANNIYVPANATVHDAVCFMCNVDLEGKSTGDVVVFFGSVHIAGAAGHDVVNFFGGVKADDDASIGQDLVSMFGSIDLGENVSVGKDLVAMFGSIQAADTVSVGHDRVEQSAWILYVPLCILFFIGWVVVREFRAYRLRPYYYPGYPYPPRM